MPLRGGMDVAAPGPWKEDMGSTRIDAAPAPVSREDVIERTWREYKRTGSRVHQEQLVTHYMTGHVRMLVQRFRARLPAHIEVDDLMQQAYFGLVESMERYDLSRNTRFEAFAGQRIIGELYDHLRRIDPVSRQARHCDKTLREAAERFEKVNGRAPSEIEMQRELHLDDVEYDRFMKQARIGSTVSTPVQRTETQAEHDPRLVDSVADDDEFGPDARAQDRDLRHWFLRGLTREDKLIVTLYYFEGFSLREIGLTIGISESRVSQKKDEILLQLRARFSGDPAVELLAS